MTQEEKDLLLKDLSSRLPYGVKCKAIDKNPRFFIDGKYEYVDDIIKNIGILKNIESTTEGILFGLKNIQCSTQNKYYILPALWKFEDIKPYLRPMSSMTEEEKEEYCNLQDRFFLSSKYLVTDAHEIFDWLNAHYFDYRGLIPMGLALEAPEDIYNNKTE